eukprot:5383995-Amphidinium_carterae.1
MVRRGAWFIITVMALCSRSEVSCLRTMKLIQTVKRRMGNDEKSKQPASAANDKGKSKSNATGAAKVCCHVACLS